MVKIFHYADMALRLDVTGMVAIQHGMVTDWARALVRGSGGKVDEVILANMLMQLCRLQWGQWAPPAVLNAISGRVIWSTHDYFLQVLSEVR